MYKRKIKNFKLFESPDTPSSYFEPITGEYRDLGVMDYQSSDAFPFGYVSTTDIDKFIHLKNYKKSLKELKNNENEIPDFEKRIKELINVIRDKKEEINNFIKQFNVKNLTEFYNLPKIKREGRNYIMFVSEMGTHSTHYELGSPRWKQKLNGRIWFNSKYISFWEYPKSYEELIQVIKDIEFMYNKKYNKKLNILQNLDEWLIEDSNGYVILVKDYKGGKAKYSEEDMKAPHLMNWEEKERWKKKQNFDQIAAKNQKKRPIEWRHALGKWRGESKIQKFDDYEKI